MDGKQFRRQRIIEDVIAGHRSQKHAAVELGCSVRSVKRYCSRVRSQGLKGLVHGLKGRPGNRRLKETTKTQILQIWKDKYGPAELNFTHFTEKLNSEENILVGRETIRKLLRTNNLSQRRVKKSRKHRSRRERKARQGELLQMDTSWHDWFSTGQKAHLIAIVDDACSTLLHAQFFQRDGTLPNMAVLKHTFTKHGLPMAVYVDRAAWFVNQEQGKKVVQTHKENRTQKETQTQIQRALQELGVELIPAYSPQAKGRIERAFGTLQDRLISELRLRQITELDQANKFLQNTFLPDYNSRFSQPPKDPQSAFVPLANPDILDEILCIQHRRTVLNDNTVHKPRSFSIQLLPTPERLNWAQAPVIVKITPEARVIVRHANDEEIIPAQLISLELPREHKYLGESDLEKGDSSKWQAGDRSKVQ